jgi:hypothetical protein
MNVNKAIALGFCDGVLTDEKRGPAAPTEQDPPKQAEITDKTTIKSLYGRLNLLSGRNYQ